MKISIGPFKGLLPKFSERILPESNATKAIGCDMRSGEIRPFKKSALVEAIGTASYGTIFRWYEASGNSHWLVFPSGVDVVQGPVVDDVWQRIYWTGDNRYSTPRMSYAGPIQSGSPMPGVSYKMGVPAPSDQLTVNPAPIIVNTVTAIHHERPIRVETQDNHGLQTGEMVSFDIEASQPSPDETYFADLLNSAEFNIVVTGDKEFTLDNTDAFNVEYSDFTTGTVSQYFDPGLLDTRFYVQTYVNNLGEEGPPSEPTESIELGYTQKVTLQLPAISPTDSQGRLIETRRIYRTATGNRYAQFQFVGEVPIYETSFQDNVLGEELGETLPSAEWDTPNDNLKGLRVAAQGYAAGFFDNVVAFSEPNMLHAWPTSYQLALDYEVVALETVDHGVVVATKGRPYIIQGTEPRSMLPRRLENNYACVSARSMVTLGYAAIYATTEGLVYIAGGSAQLITQGLFTEKEWAEYAPETITAFAHQGQYIAFYDNGTKKGGFIFNPRSPETGIVEIDFWAKHGFVDPQERYLYWLDESGNIKRWDDPAEDDKPFAWRSKEFVTMRPENMGYGKIAADNYPVTFNLYADGVLKYTKEVASENVFPMPAKYLSRAWHFEVEGTAHVQSMQFSDSYEEIE